MTKIEFPSDNWMGMKPKDNIIYGSNIKFSFDDSKIIFSDSEFLPTVKEAFKIGNHKIPIIVIDDCEDFSNNIDESQTYEDFLNEGSLEDTKFDLSIEDEWFPISLSYTSGTTGNPKGVVTHHRGAYLNALSNHLTWHMKKNPVSFFYI